MILINRAAFEISLLEFPILINGADKTGASHYSIELLAELYKAGNKIVFFSGYEMAKTSFKKLTGDSFDTEKVLILEDANETQLVEVLDTLPDIHDRILYIKNFDLYSQQTIEKILSFSKLLFMGNLESAKTKDVIESFEWKTKIWFGRPEVEKYYAVIESEKLSGVTYSKE